MSFEANRDLFMEEASELLQSLEASLLALESTPGQPTLVNDVFRALHTIKGSGAMFGFDQVSEFTHHLENLFDQIRKGLVLISPGIISLGLKSVDFIRLLLSGTQDPQVRKELDKEIQKLSYSEVPLPPVPGEVQEKTPGKSAPAPAPEKTEKMVQAYRIIFTPDRDILFRGVRLEPLFEELRSLGLYHCSLDTSALPPLAEMEPDQIYGSWTISLSTPRTLGEVREVFMFVEDYARLTVEQVSLVDGEGGHRVPLLGEVLVGRRAVNPGDVEEIRQAQKAFGEVAVETGKVRRKDLEGALAEQQILRSTVVEREVKQESSSIRVKKEKLDHLVDAVGELVILQARLSQEAKKAGLPQFDSISESMARLTATLRDSTMNIRMVPLEESFSGFQRLVRDLSKQLDKDLKLEIHGASTELDKNMIESLKDPLIHIIRNSADHGIESREVRVKKGKDPVGTITISAVQSGSRVEIEIRDDGAGLNLEKIKARAVERKLLDSAEQDANRIMSMIFEPGFSTAEKTTNLSGRGVGMDVVKTNIEKLRGEVTISSEKDLGTRIVLAIPLTLVIVDGLLVNVSDVNYVVPLSLVQECIEDSPALRTGNSHHHIIHFRDRTLPVLDLRTILTGTPAPEGLDSRLVIISQDGTVVALKVDQVVGKQQVVIKPFTVSLKRIPEVSGATILGDGSVALILNTAELVKTTKLAK